MLKILGRQSSSNVQKLLWLLGELEVPFTREDMGGKFGGNQTAGYLALNPNGVVPTLIDEDFVLWESNTICRYLATKCGPTSLYPADPKRRASCERWMDWQLTTLSPALVPLYVQMVRTPAGQRNAGVIADSRHRGRGVLAILDRALASTAYVDSDELTLADVCNGIWAHRWFELNKGPHEGLANLRAWYEHLGNRKPYRDCVLAVALD